MQSSRDEEIQPQSGRSGLRLEHVLLFWVVAFARALDASAGEHLNNELIRDAITQCIKSRSCDGAAEWDTSRVTDMQRLFNLNSDVIQAFNVDLSRWNTTSVERMDYMFSGATAFNADISRWDVSRVKTMARMFEKAAAFNGELSVWEVGAVTDMAYMFSEAASFNADISRWTVSQVRSMSFMFSEAASFNVDISRWDTGRVVEMSGMFQFSSFNRPIGEWRVSRVHSFGKMFHANHAFDQDLAGWDTSALGCQMAEMFARTRYNRDIADWDTSSVVSMRSMFFDSAFNQPIGKWDVGTVEDFLGMFRGATAFNQDLSGWQIGKRLQDGPIQMAYMFLGASSFNQPLGSWKTGKVQSMSYMFAEATKFNQDLSRWDTSNVHEALFMFNGAEAFNHDLSAWDLNNTRAEGRDGTVGMIAGTQKLSLGDINECTEPAACACAEGSARCTNTDGSFLCACELFPLRDACPSGHLTLAYAAIPQVSCALLGPGCSGELPGGAYQCTAGEGRESGPGPECDRQFQALLRLCGGGDAGAVLVPANLERFDRGGEAREYRLSSEEAAQLGQALGGLEGGGLAGQLRVEVEGAGEEEEWRCGGEPTEAYLDLGAGGRAVPWVYLAVTTALTMAGEAVINLREALDQRHYGKLLAIALDAAAEVVGGVFLVGGTQTVQVSQGGRVSHCTLAGEFGPGLRFELAEDCGDLQRIQRLGLDVQPMCRTATILTVTGLCVALADLLFSLLLLLAYWEPLRRRIWGDSEAAPTAGAMSGASSELPPKAGGAADTDSVQLVVARADRGEALEQQERAASGGAAEGEVEALRRRVRELELLQRGQEEAEAARDRAGCSGARGCSGE